MTTKFVDVCQKGDCDRCGEWSNHLWTMGSTRENTHLICDKCHKIWRTKYIIPLDKMHLDWNQRTMIWHESYFAFLSNAEKKQKVQFT